MPVPNGLASASILQVLKYAKDLAIEQLQIEEVGCLGKAGQARPGMEHVLDVFHLPTVS